MLASYAERQWEYRRVIAAVQAKGKVRDIAQGFLPDMPETSNSSGPLSRAAEGNTNMRNRRPKGSMGKKVRVRVR